MDDQRSPEQQRQRPFSIQTINTWRGPRVSPEELAEADAMRAYGIPEFIVGHWLGGTNEIVGPRPWKDLMPRELAGELASISADAQGHVIAEPRRCLTFDELGESLGEGCRIPNEEPFSVRPTGTGHAAAASLEAARERTTEGEPTEIKPAFVYGFVASGKDAKSPTEKG